METPITLSVEEIKTAIKKLEFKPTTTKNYAYWIKRFLTTMDIADTANLTIEDCQNYIQKFRNPRTQHVIQYALNLLLEIVKLDQFIELPKIRRSRRLRLQKVRKKIVNVLTFDAMRKILQAENNIQKRIMIET